MKMANKFETLPMNPEPFDCVDIPTMGRMTEEEYVEYVNGDSLFRVDHHGVLRCAKTGRPFACTLQQLTLMIEYLESERSRIGE
jgi:hypothetical protein